MIDFRNSRFFKLREVDNAKYESLISTTFTENESILHTFKGIRDGLILTNKRIITINIKGLTGVKKDITSLPYSAIQIFSAETAGVFDMDGELDVWFTGLGKLRFKFTRSIDIFAISKIISEKVL